MMKVSFIYTPNQRVNRCYYTEKIWKNYSENAIQLPNLGMAYLAGLLREKGFDVQFIDANVLNLAKEEIIARLNDFKPEYLLYSSITDNFQDTLSWIEEIKQDYNKPVIIGGPHMEIFPEETLTYDCIDYGVIGDGWETLPELLSALNDKKDISEVKGVCFRKDGKVVVTDPRPKHVGLEDVPFPARDLLPNEKYDTVLSKKRPITTMITTLGCPFRCTYCCTETKIRSRSAEHIVAEIEECINRYGIKEIEFYDETFTIDKKRMFKVLDLIEEKGLDFLWSIRTRADCVNREMIQRMAKAGCMRINYGIESADEKILESINRDIPPQMIKDAVKWSREAGITVFGFFMIGLPGDTKESIEKTLDLMVELDLDFVQLNKFVPIPKSEIYEDIKRDTGEDFWRDYTLGKVDLGDFKPYRIHVSPQELDDYLDKGYKMFYYRPKYIWQKLLSVRSFRELCRMASAALSLK
ncbi:MAG: B12-binding domain-containing radical SAM protein [Candidatus Omnitrophica bacterium]|nr:B12-binding domain-containing radical SAM protein [Candidatus Omnitrophota bacterium]